MKHIQLIALTSALSALSVASCSSKPKPDPNISRPLSNLTLPAEPLLAKRHFLRVSDGRIWLFEDDLSDRSRARALIRQHSADNESGDWNFTEHLHEVVGPERSFTFVTSDGKKLQKVQVLRAEFYLYDRTRPDFYERHAKRFGSCNGYPATAWILSVEDSVGRRVGSGYLFPQGVTLHSKPKRAFPKAYGTYRRIHTDFVRGIYPEVANSYGPIVDSMAFAVSMPNGDLYFFGPSPAVGDNNERVYLFKKDSQTPETLTLPPSMMCAS